MEEDKWLKGEIVKEVICDPYDLYDLYDLSDLSDSAASGYIIIGQKIR